MVGAGKERKSARKAVERGLLLERLGIYKKKVKL